MFVGQVFIRSACFASIVFAVKGQDAFSSLSQGLKYLNRMPPDGDGKGELKVHSAGNLPTESKTYEDRKKAYEDHEYAPQEELQKLARKLAAQRVQTPRQQQVAERLAAESVLSDDDGGNDGLQKLVGDNGEPTSLASSHLESFAKGGPARHQGKNAEEIATLLKAGDPGGLDYHLARKVLDLMMPGGLNEKVLSTGLEERVQRGFLQADKDLDEQAALMEKMELAALTAATTGGTKVHAYYAASNTALEAEVDAHKAEVDALLAD